MSQLNHPAILKVINAFEENSRNYLELEYVEGTTLRTLVNTYGPRRTQEVVSWICQIADALNYMHSKSPPIIHRDLTPENVMLDPYGKIKVIDFGSATKWSMNDSVVVGKLAYMPPEQVRGKSVIQSDVYALGGILYFLITGFDPPAFVELHPRFLNKSVSPELDQLVAACTQQIPENRPQNVEEVGALLKGLGGKTMCY